MKWIFWLSVFGSLYSYFLYPLFLLPLPKRRLPGAPAELIHAMQATRSPEQLADVVAALFFAEMRFDPANPQHAASDRFVLSKGHAAPLLYAAWAEAGYVKRDEARGTYLESHFRWQIRTFWFALLWVIIAAIVSAPSCSISASRSYRRFSGTMALRASLVVAWREIASVTGSFSAASCSMRGMTPLVERTMRRGLIPRRSGSAIRLTESMTAA